jgi:cytoskeletal protein RodZ
MTDLDSRLPDGRRSRRKPIWIAVAVVVVIGVAVGLALFQPWRIFTRSTVDEALPVAVVDQNQAMTSEMVSVAPLNPEAMDGGAMTSDAMTPEERTSATTSPAAVEPEAMVSQAPTPAVAESAEAPEPAAERPAESIELASEPASAEPVVLASGTFVDGEHATSGTANVLQLPDGSRFVRLEGFSTSDGPDVHVWVTDQQAGGDDWGKYDDGRYISLGSLKGTDGNQNYAIPADADLSGLSSVVVWCDRFNVAFGSAPVAL